MGIKKQKKPWGVSVELYPGKYALRVKKGGYSSIHYHRTLHNTIGCISGLLLLYLFEDAQNIYSPTRYFVLSGGAHVCVKAGTSHQFFALDGECSGWETYTHKDGQEIFFEDFGPKDITRLSKNGLAR